MLEILIEHWFLVTCQAVFGAKIYAPGPSSKSRSFISMSFVNSEEILSPQSYIVITYNWLLLHSKSFENGENPLLLVIEKVLITLQILSLHRLKVIM